MQYPVEIYSCETVDLIIISKNAVQSWPLPLPVLYAFKLQSPTGRRVPCALVVHFFSRTLFTTWHTRGGALAACEQLASHHQPHYRPLNTNNLPPPSCLTLTLLPPPRLPTSN